MRGARAATKQASQFVETFAFCFCLRANETNCVEIGFVTREGGAVEECQALFQDI